MKRDESWGTDYWTVHDALGAFNLDTQRLHEALAALDRMQHRLDDQEYELSRAPS